MRVSKDSLTDKRMWQIILLQTPAVILVLLLCVTAGVAIFEYCSTIMLPIDLFRMIQISILSGIIITTVSISLYIVSVIKINKTNKFSKGE